MEGQVQPESEAVNAPAHAVDAAHSDAKDDSPAEREKWDRYYADLPLAKIDEPMRRFNAQLVAAVGAFLKPGSQVLEAGCGGGWQSLALAQSQQYPVSLMDFSENALDYARRVFERARIPATFLAGDVLAPGEPAYDLVFNAGVLEHYTLGEQTTFLRGMASRSRHYVLVLVPNPQCYWYWLWRMRLVSKGQWSFGKEVASDDLSAAFKAAGLNVVGRAYFGEDWTDSFIASLSELAPDVRDDILAVHHSPLIPPAQKSYLVGWLGVVPGDTTVSLPQWAAPGAATETLLPEALAALSDALALRIGRDHQLLQLQAEFDAARRSTQEARSQLAGSQQSAAELAQRWAEQTRLVSETWSVWAQDKQRAKDLQAQLKSQSQAMAAREAALAEAERSRAALRAELTATQQTVQQMARSKFWRIGTTYWRARYHIRQLVDRPYLWLRHVLRRIIPYSLRRTVVLRMRSTRQSTSMRPASQEPMAYPTPQAFDVICFPIIDWEFRFQRPQQLMTQFAQAGHRGFYLRTTFHTPGNSAVVQTVAAGVFGIQLPGPAQLNLYQDQLAASTRDEALEALNELRSKASIQEAVCLVQLPFWRPLALAARERWGWKIVYDCLDEHSGFGTMRPEMAEDESDLIEQSDLVLATARPLYARVAEHARQALLVPNAADFDHFAQRPPTLPLGDLSGPVIGYYGAIAEWFEVDMIRNAAVARPDWHFVLIGHVMGADLRPLGSLPNVHLLGEKPYAELPGYLHRFDVACIPFKLNALTNATNPVKFYEYLSAGKPVVAVDLPELAPYQEYFYLVKSVADFVPQCEAALRERAPGLAEARVAFARQNTWSQRSQAVLAAIPALYGKASLIIISYNHLDFLSQCLDSIFAKTAYPNFEVIVVDNGSGSDVTAYLERYAQREPRLKLILNGANLGFARANNIGVQAAGPSEFVVLLNNDTIVTPGWLSKLIAYLHNPQVGLVGPVTNGAGNEARIDVSYNSVNDLDRFAAEYTRDHDGQVFDIPMLAMYCVALRRQLFDEIGPLDERFGIGLFEDDDYSLRVKKAGYRVICAPDIYVHHWMKASFGNLPNTQYEELFNKNRRQFEEKWGLSWTGHHDRLQTALARGQQDRPESGSSSNR